MATSKPTHLNNFYYTFHKMAVPEGIEPSLSARQADIIATRSWDQIWGEIPGSIRSFDFHRVVCEPLHKSHHINLYIPEIVFTYNIKPT
jgi:hypothetical protein